MAVTSLSTLLYAKTDQRFGCYYRNDTTSIDLISQSR